jgi:hypothetical protein
MNLNVELEDGTVVRIVEAVTAHSELQVSLD